MKTSKWNASAVMVWSGREPVAEGRVGDTLLPCNLAAQAAADH
jgi:hypothetical protein